MSHGRTSLFRTWQFWMLCASAIGAYVLNHWRDRFYGNDWFLMAIAMIAVMAIVPLQDWTHNFFQAAVPGGLRDIIFFATGSLFFCAGSAFLFSTGDFWFGLLSVGITGLLGYGALGTRYRWPGFREPYAEWECYSCGYDLRGIVSDHCPKCGMDTGQSDVDDSELE